MTYWYDSTYGRARLLEEIELVRTHCDDASFQIVDGIAEFSIPRLSNTGQRYSLHVKLPADYPHSLAVVTVRELPAYLKRGHAIHRYDAGNLCLVYPGDAVNAFGIYVMDMVTYAAAWMYNYENLCLGATGWLGNEAPIA